MATLDMNSKSQVTAIMSQIYHISLPNDWLFYITLLDEVVNDRPEAWASNQTLEVWLRQFPVIQIFDDMLKEELTSEGPRTLPSALSAVYPWNTTPNEVVDAYINFALQREDMLMKPKDAEAARTGLKAILRAELNLPGSQKTPVLHPDEITQRLSEMQINTSRDIDCEPLKFNKMTLDEELDVDLEAQDLPDRLDSMQLE